MSVEEAREFFENNARRLTRSDGNEGVQGVFAVGEIVPDWDQPALSANSRLECVDVAARTDSEFRILRRRDDGSMYEVRAYGKLLIAKSPETDSLAAYMRYVVPDEIYTDYYDGDLSDLFANCDERSDYCGLEIYTALDGAIVAAAKYYEGILLDRVFLGDERLSRKQRDYRLRYLLRGVFIHRSTSGMTRNSDFDFGGRECFYDSTGTLYFVKYLNGVGYATMDFDHEHGGCKDGKIVDPGDNGGLGGGSTDDDDKGGDNPGRGPGPGIGGPDPGGPGYGGGGGSGSGNDNGNETDPEPDFPYNPSPDSIVIIERPEPPQPPKFPFIWIDPIPFDPISPEIFPEPEPDEPDKPEEEKPCADSLNYEANPLLEMQISDDNKSWKSNTWGKVRNKGTKFHDGLDLKGVEGETLVYAMYEGKVKTVVWNQPKRISSKIYPADYLGPDFNGAGNRVTIETKMPDGRIIEVSYWHLDIKENNPYTYQLSAGSHVRKGQVIGVVGMTGNAVGGKPHLHIKTYISGTNKEEDSINNPMNYIYTKFDSETAEIIRDC